MRLHHISYFIYERETQCWKSNNWSQYSVAQLGETWKVSFVHCVSGDFRNIPSFFQAYFPAAFREYLT